MTLATRGSLYWQVLALKRRGFSLQEIRDCLLDSPPTCQDYGMSVSDLDIWRAARLLLDRHKDVAGLVAAQRADELLESGDVERSNIWKRILAAIDDWQRDAPRRDERVN